ncbi:hypothetical protein [Bradyrhizobium elkanii]|uniref:hypothetical protein n=1 Tax=Bradyrhizobium elkanii TaxID=29448 RepID=UPI00351938B5
MSTSRYRVISLSGITIGTDFYDVNSIVTLTPGGAKYFLLNKQIALADGQPPIGVPGGPSEDDVKIEIYINNIGKTVSLTQLRDMFPSFKGDQGDQGVRGLTGPQGARGPQGDVGHGIRLAGIVATAFDLPPVAAEGNDVYLAQDSSHGWAWSNGAWIDIGPFRGPEGKAGPAGPKGEAGPRGPQGDKGEPGDPGDPSLAQQTAANAASSSASSAAAIDAASRAATSEAAADGHRQVAVSKAAEAAGSAATALTNKIATDQVITTTNAIAAAAAASASAASTSETNAKAAETNAGTKAGNAATSAAHAATSEANAESSASDAAASENNAANSASAAATSASRAATSEGNAAGSATAAATSKSGADTSASNASTYASNAQASYTNALNVLNNFKGTYYGAAAADPATDPNGGAKDAGDFYFNTATKTMRYWNGAIWLDMVADGPVGQCKLIYSGTTTLKLVPCDGNRIKINGQLYQVPSAGVTITNAGLGASTLYYVYAMVTGGAVALTISTTGHIKSATAGSVGVEVMNVAGGEQYTLVGMIWTGVDKLFYDSPYMRWVRSWFNDFGVTAYQSATGQVNTTSSVPVELDTAMRVYILLWANEQYHQTVNCSMTNNTLGAMCYLMTGNTTWSYTGIQTYSHTDNVSYSKPATVSYANAFTVDNPAIFLVYGQVGSGTGTFGYKSQSIVTVRR